MVALHTSQYACSVPCLRPYGGALLRPFCLQSRLAPRTSLGKITSYPPEPLQRGADMQGGWSGMRDEGRGMKRCLPLPFYLFPPPLFSGPRQGRLAGCHVPSPTVPAIHLVPDLSDSARPP